MSFRRLFSVIRSILNNEPSSISWSFASYYFIFIRSPLQEEGLLQSVVKKWFKDKNFGFIENGSGPDIYVNSKSLQNCKYLKVGASVEFTVHIEQNKLVAKQVRLQRHRQPMNNVEQPRFVMS